MTFENTILNNLSEWRPNGRQTLTIALPDSPWKVQLTADRCDELSAQLWELRLQRDEGEHGQTLPNWAKQLSGKQIGLLDLLKVLEVDAERQQSLLRSETPTKRNDQLFYYELVLENNTAATLRRFKGSYEPGSKREQVPFVLTHEVIEQVCTAVVF